MLTEKITTEDIKDILARKDEWTIPHEVIKAHVTMKAYIQESQKKTPV